MNKSDHIREALQKLNTEDPEFVYGLRADIENPSPKRPENYRRQNKNTLKIESLGYRFDSIIQYINTRYSEIEKLKAEKRIRDIVNDIEKTYARNLLNSVKRILSYLNLDVSKFTFDNLAPFIIRASGKNNDHIIRYIPCIYAGTPPFIDHGASPLIKLYQVETIKDLDECEAYFTRQALAIIPDAKKAPCTLYGVDLRKDDHQYRRLSKAWDIVNSFHTIINQSMKYDYKIVYFEIFTYSALAPVVLPRFTMANQIQRKNCLIECAKYEQAIKANLDTIYARAPLSIDSDRFIIASENLHKFATQNRLRLRVYTAYGVIIDKPIMDIGYPHDKILNIRYDEGHARIVRRDINIRCIKYREQRSNINKPDQIDNSDLLIAVDDIIKHPVDVDENASAVASIVADTSANVIEEFPNYKIVQELDGHTLYKDFKPSSFTKNPEDDQKLEYARCFDSFNVFYKLFKQKNRIKSTREHIEQYTAAARISCIKSGIIGGGSILPDVQNYIVCDHIKSYSSFERSEYYMGMPTQEYTREIPVSDQYFKQNKNLFSLAYVTIEPQESEMFRIVDELILHSARKLYIPSPLLACFDVIGIKYTASAGIQTTFNKSFGIIDLAEKYNVPKEYPNKAFGKLIAGGLSTRDNYTHITVSDQNAADLIKYEMHRDNVNYSCVHTNNGAEFTADITKRPKINSVHISAFIYAYSAAALITEIYNNYRDYALLPCAYYVDGLLYARENPLLLSKHSTERGKFKYIESTQQDREFLPYRLLENSKRPQIVYGDIPEPSVCEYLRDLPSCNKILVNLPGGIGKTYTMLNHLPSAGVAIIAPTNNRVNGLRADMFKIYGDKYNEDIMTCHKFFGVGVTEDATKENLDRYKNHAREYRSRVINRKNYSAIILDEFTLTNTIILSAVEDVAERIKANIYILGDIQQCNLGFDAPITENTFNNYYTIGSHIYPRRPDMKCRHSYEVGEFFDTLREMQYNDQLLELIKPENVRKYGYKVISRSEHMAAIEEEARGGSIGSVAVCGIHARAAFINSEYLRICRMYNLTVRGIRITDTSYAKAQYANDCPDLFIKKNMKDRSGRVMLAYARSIYTLQGDTIEGSTKLYVDIESCTNSGELYTAITRVRDTKNIILVLDPYAVDEY